MKRFIITALFILLVIQPFTAYADEYNDYLHSFDLSAFDELNKDTRDALEYLGIDGFDYEKISSFSMKQAIEYLKNLILQRVNSPIKSLSIIIIFIVASTFMKSLVDGEMSDAYSLISTMTLAIYIVSCVSDCLGLTCSTIRLCADFTFAFFPAFCIIVAASGSALSSFSVNTFLLILSQFISYVSKLIFLPLIQCFMSVGICIGISDEINLSGALSGFRSLITKIISTLSAVYVSILSMKTAVSARADSLGIRSVRFVINSVVPVIGGTISEGLLSIQAYSSLIKTSVGIVGICAVILIFLPSLIEVTAWRIVIALGQICAQAFSCSKEAQLMTAIGDTLILINVVQILTMVTTIISIGILIAARTM